MIEKINSKAIIISIFIGVFIGIGVELLFDKPQSVDALIVAMITGGIIGLIIGSVTEFLTALIPISMAKASVYYIINNIIALMVAILIIGGGSIYFNATLSIEESIKKLLFVCVMITGANGIDYLNYRKTNKQLERYKKKRKEED
ncbi:MAG: hypothetical protein ACRDDX_02570 [Cellulosilyticaceae bacterium]